jgi:hypothetical protein
MYFIFIHLFNQFIHCSYCIQCAYIPTCCPHVTDPFPLPGSIPLRLTLPRPQFRVHNSWLFLRWQVDLSPNPQPGGSAHRIFNPRGRIAQLYPQAAGIHFSRLLRPAWAAVELFFTSVTIRGPLSLYLATVFTYVATMFSDLLNLRFSGMIDKLGICTKST